MSPLLSPMRKGRRAAWITPLALAALAACDRAPTQPADASLTPHAVLSTAIAPLSFTVQSQSGQPVPDVTVRVYGVLASTGQVGLAGSAATDAAGFVTFQLPEGNYCATARLAPIGWTSLTFVAPPTPLTTATSVPVNFGPVVRGNDIWRSFTDATFQACYTNLPIGLGPNGAHETVPLGQSFVVNASVKGLNGEDITGAVVYAVTPIADVPWRPATIDPSIRTGFFEYLGVTASPINLAVPPNTPWNLEVQQSINGFDLTGSVSGFAGAGGGSTTMDVQVEPLVCELTTQSLPTGQPGLDFLQFSTGYGATLSLTPNLSEASLQMKHVGDGHVTVRFRTFFRETHWTTRVDYDCINGQCGSVVVVNTPSANHQTLDAFFNALGGGVTKTTLVLQGIPSRATDVLFAAKAPNDRIPLVGPGQDPETKISLNRPTQCSVQRSNDDKWWVADT